MSIKKLFEKEGPLSKKPVKKTSGDDLAKEIESKENLLAKGDEKDRFLAPVSFHPASASHFAKYGSAEQYYEDAIDRIVNEFPYDGSEKELTEWNLSSSQIDLWVLENVYPRTHGYIMTSYGGWGSLNGSKVSGYGTPSSKEYIEVRGGPHTASMGMNPMPAGFPHSNIYNSDISGSGTRESNLKFDLDSGATIEFWLKKASFDTDKTSKEVVFDMWNGNTAGSANYGRLRIELNATASDSPFRISCRSGSSAGFGEHTSIGQDIAVSTLSDWHHYAVVLQNSGSVISTRLYVDGLMNDSQLIGTTIGNVTGSMIANIGALRARTEAISGVGHGAGKLSASIDEFRYWKTARTPREIYRHWWSQIRGGTNTDLANTTLGVYYKFNEGITQTASIDSVVLDYSGRISNGIWAGYSSGARATGSAMILAGASSTEYKDPIIRKQHPTVVDARKNLMATGSLWDMSNNSSMYHSLPSWIVDFNEDMSNSKDIKRLTQVIGSYFDTLDQQIRTIRILKNTDYLSSSHKPFPFMDRILENAGLNTPELFANAHIIERILSRDEKSEFKRKIYDTKNFIYKNIYNNLAHIYKTKGTEKSLRNVLHCFGIDEKIVKLNLYADNSTYSLIKNDQPYGPLKEKSVLANCADFDQTERFTATVYQYSDGTNINAASYITGSKNTDKEVFLGATLEANVIFPQKSPFGHPAWYPTSFTDTSIFGIHTVPPTSSTYVWPTEDSANFQVMAIRTEIDSKDVYFKLTSSFPYPIPELTSSLYYDVYNDENWHFAVSIKPSKYPLAGRVDGAISASEFTYDLEFRGYNNSLDYIKNSFLLTASLSNQVGKNFLTSSKRVFCGAHRKNFTGLTQQSSDVAINSISYWARYIEEDSIKTHARDMESYGAIRPYKSAILHSGSKVNIPEIDTLALHWNFSDITGSDSNGTFNVADFSSGSLSMLSGSGRLDWLSKITKYQHTGRGYGFPNNNTGSVQGRYVTSAKQQLPEMVYSSDMIQIRGQDDDKFTRESRPIKYFMNMEKSMYQSISTEMINFFSTIVDFNNMMGEPVNRYRQEYKTLEKLRQLFFERVGDTPELDKYVEYYKWIDSALGDILSQFVPAGTRGSDNLRTMVESHVLERNKYWTKFPTLEMQAADPEARLYGISEMLYDWKRGHAPVVDKENTNCSWYHDRALRDQTGIIIDSGNDAVDEDREAIRDVTGKHVTTSSVLKRYDNKTSTVYEGSTYALTRFPKVYRYTVDESAVIHGGTNYGRGKNLDLTRLATYPQGPDQDNQYPANVILVDNTDVYLLDDCTDEYKPNQKKKYFFGARQVREFGESRDASPQGYYGQLKGNFSVPFSLYSASISTEYHESIENEFFSGSTITNLHSDGYATNEIPIQGPFTEKYVGGRQYRHIDINQGTDTDINRPEGWKLLLGFSEDIPPDPGKGIEHRMLGIVGPDYPDSTLGDPSVNRPRATLLREETAKRPVNIKNIKHTTGSGGTVIGNYEKTWQYVQTHGRTNNNALLRDYDEEDSNSSLLPTLLRTTLPATTHPNTIIELDTTDATLPVRPKNDSVFVNRFSAPGGPDIMSRGSLDISSEEYSSYNALPFRNLLVRGSGSGEASRLGQFGETLEATRRGNRGFARLNTHMNGTSSASGSRDGLRTLLSRPSGRFGTDSKYGEDIGSLSVNPYRDPIHGVQEGLTSTQTASYHKVNRNPLRRVEAVLNLNAATRNPDGYTYYTASAKDNWWVQHAIPRSDKQYSWISASYMSSTGIPGDDNVMMSDGDNLHLYGHAPISGMVSASAGGFIAAIQFQSASQFGSVLVGGVRKFGQPEQTSVSTQYVGTDFVGLNTNIEEEMDGATQTVGASSSAWMMDHHLNRDFVSHGFHDNGSAAIFNGIILNRQGPYGWPSWKQIRASEHPVVRNHLKPNNYISVVVPYTEEDLAYTNRYGERQVDSPGSEWIKRGRKLITVLPTTKMSALRNTTMDRGSSFKQYRESPIVLNLPMLHLVGSMEFPSSPDLPTENSVGTYIRHSYRNVLTKFTSDELNEKLGVDEVDNGTTTYKKLLKTYTEGPMVFNYMAYSEGVYPREQNRYNNKVRTRENYIVSFWNSVRANRNEVGESINENSDLLPAGFNSAGRPFNTGSRQSVWPLDAHAGWLTGSVFNVHSGSLDDNGAFDHHLRYLNPFVTTSGNSNAALQKTFNTALSGAALGQGELQSTYVQIAGVYHPTFHDEKTTYPGNEEIYNARIRGPGIIYARRNTLPTQSANVSPSTGLTSTELFNMGISATSGTQAYMAPFAGETLWEAATQAGKTPFKDTYAEWAKDVRTMGKEYTIVPEFRISDWMEYYLIEKDGDFLAENTSSFKLPGGSHASSAEDAFFSTYGHTDFMERFSIISQDHSFTGGPTGITLQCSVIKKFLPYEGFYPVQRTVELANLFSASYGNYIQIEDPQAVGKLEKADTVAKQQLVLQNMLTPFFAPGILYNTIKSGMAVDYPIMTGSYNVRHGFGDDWQTNTLAKPVHASTATVKWYEAPKLYNYGHHYNHQGVGTHADVLKHCRVINDNFHKRIPFEALVEPENYLSATPVVNTETHSGSIHFTDIFKYTHPHARWLGTGDDRYKMAMNNFLGEVPEFFLEGENFTTLVSSREDKFAKTQKGKNCYSMLVKIEKSVTERSHLPLYRHLVPWVREGSETITMYSRPTAFGPPFRHQALAGYNTPYTPPYYDGASWAILRFQTPQTDNAADGLHMGGKQYSLQDIASSLTIQYIRTCWNPTLGRVIHQIDDDPLTYALEGDGRAGGTPGITGGATFATANAVSAAQHLSELAGDPSGSLSEANSMQLSASMNLFSQASVGKVTYDSETGRASEVLFDPSSDDKRWIMQMKFETPILNFIDSSMTIPTHGKESISKGMWHQYGAPPTDPNIGIFLQVTDVPRNWVLYSKTQNLTSSYPTGSYDWNGAAEVTGSLANLVGFPKKKIRLGSTAKSKVVSEAVVAVPFVEQDGERKFFNVGTADVAAALQYLEGNIPTELPGDSVIDMVSKMSKYVFPPKMDFVTNLDEVQPYAAYIFEFVHELNQQDLSDIWQNLPPGPVGGESTIEKQTATISHQLLTKEILGAVDESSGDILPCNLQWMVFKVKKKAQWNYSDKIFGESATESAVTKLVGKTSKTEAVLKTASGRDIGKKRSDNPGKTEFLSRKGEQESKIKPHVDTSGPTRTLAGTELGKSRELEIAAEKTTSIPDYNYNWPYDYFSLVELVKIDASVTWGSLPEKRTKSPGQATPAGITRTTDNTVVVEEGTPGRTLGDTRGKK
jgi:hypothetical protein